MIVVEGVNGKGINRVIVNVHGNFSGFFLCLLFIKPRHVLLVIFCACRRGLEKPRFDQKTISCSVV